MNLNDFRFKNPLFYGKGDFWESKESLLKFLYSFYGMTSILLFLNTEIILVERESDIDGVI